MNNIQHSFLTTVFTDENQYSLSRFSDVIKKDQSGHSPGMKIEDKVASDINVWLEQAP